MFSNKNVQKERVFQVCALRVTRVLNAACTTTTSNAFATRLAGFFTRSITFGVVSRCATWTGLPRASDGGARRRNGGIARVGGWTKGSQRISAHVQRKFRELFTRYGDELVNNGLATGVSSSYMKDIAVLKRYTLSNRHLQKHPSCWQRSEKVRF